MSNIRINHLSYTVVPLVKNGNTINLENTSFRVAPVSAISNNVGYNSNVSKSEVCFTNVSNKKESSFEDVLQEEMAKLKCLDYKKQI